MSLETAIAGSCSLDYPGSRPSVPVDPEKKRILGEEKGKEFLLPVSTVSCGASTCASETDDGDYETSSEGPVRSAQAKRNSENEEVRLMDIQSSRNKSRSQSERTDTSRNDLSMKPDSIISRDATWNSVQSDLNKSESMPILKATLPLENEKSLDVTATSESSLVREKKLNMIVAQMEQLTSSESNLTSANASRTDAWEEKYEAKKLESRTVLPVLQDDQTELANHPKDVTFADLSRTTQINDTSADSQRTRSSKNPKIPRKLHEPQSNDDLIDIAENPHSSIKSFYFPPCPHGSDNTSAPSRKHPDLEALLKIDGELGPLQQKFSELTGKFRAMNFTDVTLGIDISSLSNHQKYSTQFAPSLSVSRYLLQRVDNFGQDSKNTEVLDKGSPKFSPSVRADEEERSLENHFVVNKHSFHESNNRDGYIDGEKMQRSRRTLEDTLARDVLKSNVSSDWLSEKDTWRTSRNSNISLTQSCEVRKVDYRKVDQERSNVSMGSAKGSCHCYRNHERSKGQSVRMFVDKGNNVGRTSFNDETRRQHRQKRTDRSTATSTDFHKVRCPNSCTNKVYSSARSFQTEISEVSHDKPVSRVVSKAACTSSMNIPSKLHVLNDPEPKKKHYNTPGVSPIQSCRFRKARTSSSTIQGHFDSHLPPEEISKIHQTPLSSDSLSHEASTVKELNRKMSNSRRPLGKQDNEKLSEDLHSAIVVRHSSECFTRKKRTAGTERKMSHRDFNVQCSQVDLKYQNDVYLGESLESLMKSSESECKLSLAKGRSISTSKDKDKIIIVPVIFTDGMPEPSGVPLFNLAKPNPFEGLLSRPNRQVPNLQMENSSKSFPQRKNGPFASNADSYAMASAFMAKSRNVEPWDRSRMSVSYVSQSRSSLKIKNASSSSNTIGSWKTGASRRSSFVHQRMEGCYGNSHRSYSQQGSYEATRKVIGGMRSSPEDFLHDT